MNEPRLPGFYRLLSFARIDSTSEAAKRRAAEDAPEGTLVWALQQSAGRGRRGRAWHSPPGNLYFSLLLRPRCRPADAAQLGFAAALAVGDACRRHLPPGAVLSHKWPNDVLVDGKKLAGVLLESRMAEGGALAWLVLGIGVNIASYPAETEHPATSLEASGAGGVTPALLLEELAVTWLAWYERWRAEGFAALRRAWLARAHGIGEPVRVRLENEELAGRFAGLDEDGVLLLDAAEGRRRIAAGDVFPMGR